MPPPSPGCHEARSAAAPRRRLLFLAVILALSLLGLELGARAIYLVSHGRGYRASDLLDPVSITDPPTLRRLVAGDLPRRYRSEILHPFLGFVRPPPDGAAESHGFATRVAVAHRQPGRLLVGVLGGSVAEQQSVYLERALAAVLAARGPGAPEPVVINLALAGYKQPQQFLAVAYLLSLGAEFDLLINIDGYNEIELPVNENDGAGVYPFFPRAWGLQVGIEKSSANFVAAGRIQYLRTVEERLGDDVRSSPFAASAVYGIVKYRDIAATASAIRRAHHDLVRLDGAARDYEKSGPPAHHHGRDELLRDCATLWRRSSLLLRDLAAANGIGYVHVLQPNLHLPGSKPLSLAERRLAGAAAAATREVIALGYPLLRAEGRGLAGQGVRFHDATQIFADREETLYADECCHYGARGNELLARWTAERALAPGGDGGPGGK